jgi:biotin transport system substrate-specific component
LVNFTCFILVDSPFQVFIINRQLKFSSCWWRIERNVSMAEVPLAQVRMLVLASLLASLTAVGAQIQIPIGPVPIVLQNLFVLLAGLLLGPRWGLTSIAVYVLVGACGAPVFAGGKGGLAAFAGPTGGYLLGYILAALVVGWIACRRQQRMSLDILAVISGSLLIYALGVPWLKWVTAWPWEKALMLGMLPFIPGDAVKAAAAVMLARTLRPMMDQSQSQRAIA